MRGLNRYYYFPNGFFISCIVQTMQHHPINIFLAMAVGLFTFMIMTLIYK